MSETEEQQPPRVRPTHAELAGATDRLLAEIDAAFASDLWAILQFETPHRVWIMYDGAALRYLAQLLRELAAAIDADMDFGVRTLARSLVEAFVMSLYVHFGQFEAVEALAGAARHSLEGLQKAADESNERLATRIRNARNSAMKLRRHHAKNPNRPDQATNELPYVPQLEPRRIDLRSRIADFGPYEAQRLPVEKMVNQLSEWAPKLGFGKEDLRPVYLDYRTLSTVGSHASLNVLNELFDASPRSHFVRIKAKPDPNDIPVLLWDVALYYTSFAAEWVLSARGCPTPESTRIRQWSQPLPNGLAPWLEDRT